jgi:plastocyanin
MRKALWLSAALIAFLSGTGVLLGGPAVEAADTTVNMVDGPGDATKVWKFEPAEITVPAGTNVIWRNTGDQPHTATADDGSFDSGNLSNGKAFSQVISKSVTYKCTPHPWMTGKITVSGGAATPTTVAPTTTTTAAAGGTTATTTAAAGATTTTTAKAAAGGSTTTTTAGSGSGVTSTTQAPSSTPSSAPETGGVTTTTAAPSGHADEAAADGHGGEESKKEDDDKSSPLGIAFAAVSTLFLVAISGKLLASKS